VDEGEKATELIALRVLPRQKLILHKLSVLKVLLVLQILSSVAVAIILGLGWIAELELRTKTTLTGSQFLTIVLVGPLFLAFVTLGVLIVWKTTSKPAEIAPHLDIILVAFAIFANPVTAAAAAVVSLMSDEIKSKMGGEDG